MPTACPRLGPLLPMTQLWSRTASTAGVQAEGCLTFNLLSPRMRSVLPQCSGRRAQCLAVDTLVHRNRRFPRTGGSRPPLRPLDVALLLNDLWHMCKKLLKATILLAVANRQLALPTSTAVAAPLISVLVTREVRACPYTRLQSWCLVEAFLTARWLTQAGWTVLRVLRVFPVPAPKPCVPRHRLFTPLMTIPPSVLR